MFRKTQTIRFMALADKHTLSNRPHYALTIVGNGEWKMGNGLLLCGFTRNRIGEQQIFKRPDTIPT